MIVIFYLSGKLYFVPFYLQILNGGTPDIPSTGLLPGQAQETPGYPYSDSSSILGKCVIIHLHE